MAFDEELILRAKALDPEALKVVADYIMLNLPPYLKSKFTKFPYDDCEDAAMDALGKFVTDPLTVRAQNMASLFAWAKMVGSNYLYDLARKPASKNQSLYSVDSEGNEMDLPLVDKEYQQRLDKMEEKLAISSMLKDALGALSIEDKYIIYEYHLAERRLEAIAEDLGIKLDAVKQRKKRALKKVKEILNNEGLSYQNFYH